VSAEQSTLRCFMLKRSTGLRVSWLNRKTVYRGKLLSMSARIVRLFAPDPADPQPHVDVSYDWLIPTHRPASGPPA
jgi:hypothetical protein